MTQKKLAHSDLVEVMIQWIDEGGSNGAGMRFNADEAHDPENAGLNAARAFLEPIKKKYLSIHSYSDLWILASYVGLEHIGGPIIPLLLAVWIMSMSPTGHGMK
jgi:catalase (peroxidase I)